MFKVQGAILYQMSSQAKIFLGIEKLVSKNAINQTKPNIQMSDCEEF